MYEMNDYLKQSGYLGAAHLEKIFPRQITAVMTTVCLVAVLACAVIAVILGSKSLFTVALLLLVLFYFLAAYFLFTNFLQEDRSLSANEIAEARAAKKLGMILNFSAVQIALQKQVCLLDKKFQLEFFPGVINNRRKFLENLPDTGFYQPFITFELSFN